MSLVLPFKIMTGAQSRQIFEEGCETVYSETVRI